MNLPNLWEFPGEKIGNGELEADASKREIKEALLYDIEVLNPFDDITHGLEAKQKQGVRKNIFIIHIFPFRLLPNFRFNAETSIKFLPGRTW